MTTPALKALAAIAALVIAGVSGLHALSSVLARNNPQLAVQLSPFPVKAYERLTTNSLALDEGQTAIDPTASLQPARHAFAAGGLSTEAAAILAFAQEDPERRARSLEAVNALSLRGRLLNFTIAQAAAERGDTQTALDALDRLLTLYANVRTELIPLLTGYLNSEDALPAFQRVLENDPEWADYFFNIGARNPDTLQNLGRLRLSMVDTLSIRPDTDRGLVRRLVQAGNWEEAFALYGLLNNNDGAGASPTSALGWDDTFPPFDWALADDRDFHARPDADFESVDIRIDAGRGGQLARRLAPKPESAGSLLIEHSLSPASSLQDMAVYVRCPETGEMLGESPMTASPMRLQLVENSCSWAEITINGRAFTGRPNIGGKIGTIRFAD